MRAPSSGTLEHRQELLAAPARDRVGQPRFAGERSGDDAQHLVAGGVSVHVVHLLEVVDIEDRHAQRDARAFLARLLRAQRGLGGAPVGDAGERVD